MVILLFYRPLTKQNQLLNFYNFIKYIKPGLMSEGLKITVLTFNNGPDDIKDLKKIDVDPVFNEIKIIAFKRVFGNDFISQVLRLGYNILKYGNVIFQNRPNLVYCYGDQTALLAVPFKKFFGYKCIFDMRGDAIDEYKTKNRGKIFLWTIIIRQKFLHRFSDLVFVVSEFYLHNGSKFFTKFNYYDPEKFYFSESTRNATRANLGVSDKFVFLYSGSFKYYQMIEESIELFKVAVEASQEVFFLILTRSPFELFENLLRKYAIDTSTYKILSLSPEELAPYMMCGDLGMLLREDLSLNHKSYPTKFSEYLACGVPVLTTPYIFSISSQVKENDLGEVISLNQRNDAAHINLIIKKIKSNPEIKQKCYNFAQKNLTWHHNSSRVLSAILDLLD